MSSSFRISAAGISRVFAARRATKFGAAAANRGRRRGVSVVEVAFVMPVFLLFIFFIMQFGHAYMVRNMLGAACRNAARLGSTSGITTDEAAERALRVLSPIAGADQVSLLVKDAALIDDGQSIPDSFDECSSLSDIELSEAEPRQPFLIRAQVRYGVVAFLVMPGFADLPIVGQAVTRHE